MEKLLFFTFLKKHFHSLHSLSFHLEYQLKYICTLSFWTNNGKIWNFWPTLFKFNFPYVFQKAFLYFTKPFFQSRISTKYISRQHRPGKCVLRYSRTKKRLLGYKHKKFKKSKNVDFSEGVNAWFWSKNGHFSIFFFVGNIGQKNVFNDILERKNAFLGYKNK